MIPRLPLLLQLLAPLTLILAGCGTTAPTSEAPGQPKRMPTSLPPEEESGAEPPPAAAPDRDEAPAGEGFSIVGVLYATDRAPTGDREPNDAFGARRSPEMHYGQAYVTIPDSHQLGIIDSPRFHHLRPNAAEDVTRHITVARLKPLAGRDDFLAAVREGVRDAEPGEAMLFIHGFNVPFATALKRTAQITCDIDYGGTPITYSWPSQGRFSPRSYLRDSEEIELSEPNLARLLLDLEAGGQIRSLHILAHSMGTRLLTNALIRAREQGFTMPVDNIVLASPDIRAEAFAAHMIPGLSPSAERITLYYNWKDLALAASGVLRDQERLGREYVPVDGVDSVDVARVSVDLLGHHDYAQARPVVADLSRLVLERLAPPRRGLVREGNGAWVFP